MRARAAAIAFALACGFASQAQTRRLDVTQFVVLGEGLAAGVQDFGLRMENQERNFAAQVARQMGTILPQPLMQGPGLAVIPGFQTPPAILPNSRQTLVRDGFPPSLFVFNLSVPGMRLTDAISRRPAEPLVRTNDPQQTLINLILGYPAMILGRGKPVWSQLEYAEQMRPTLVLVCLGYHEAADAASSGQVARMPDAASFRSNMDILLSRLRGTFAEVIVANVPDPFDTAYFTRADSATRYVGASTALLEQFYGIRGGDWVSPAGLMAIGNQILSEQIAALPEGSIVNSAAAEQVQARIRSVNAAIADSARQHGAIVYDLNALFRQVRTGGLTVGSRVLTADFLGGFYSLSGFYPGLAGHALIANNLLGLINQTYSRSFATVDVAAAASGDPALRRIQTFRKPGLPVEKQ